jgi:hypothetical protein
MSVSPASHTAPLHQVQNTPPDKQAHEQQNSPPAKKTEATEEPHHHGKTKHNLDVTV